MTATWWGRWFELTGWFPYGVWNMMNIPSPTVLAHDAIALMKLVWRSWCELFMSSDAILCRRYRENALTQHREPGSSVSLDELRHECVRYALRNNVEFIVAFVRSSEARAVFWSRLRAAWVAFWTLGLPVLLSGWWLMNRLDTVRDGSEAVNHTFVGVISLYVATTIAGTAIQAILSGPMLVYGQCFLRPLSARGADDHP